MPVDTTNLDRFIRSQIPAPQRAVSWSRILRPIAAIAASLIIVAVVGWALLSGQQVRASDMAQMHRDIVSGKSFVMPVDSMDDANKALAAFAQGFPQLGASSQMPAMGCCMKDVAGKKVFCVLLNDAGTKITMAVADADACQAAQGPAIVRGGQTYHVEALQELNMVSFDRGHHRICLIGQLPADKLMELTDGLKF